MAGEHRPIAPLALTMGEPAGVGPDVTLAAWMRRKTGALPPFYCLADPALLIERARLMGVDCKIEIVAPGDAVSVFEHALPVVPLNAAVKATPGKPSPENAQAVI